ncbi:MAG: DUF1318 domain-containing protein [Candidatus Methylomirabilis oxyfera]|nr:DUF1318 domain-containing protein [Candidatus Methylomirabilis oxyfera]
MRRNRKPLVMLTLSALFSFVACANITVNIYFPEKDVKSAYKSLEEELLQPTPKKEKEETPAQSPTSGLRQGRQSLLTMVRALRITLVAEALAQDDLSRRITEEIKGYPEVVAAYRGVGQRLARLNQLRDQGLVGEANDGKAALRASPPQVGDAEAALLREENRDREVIISGMAKAILKLTRQEGTPANLARIRTQASETFASIRRDAAHPGWWVQLPNGTWARK